jgi:hypothetical protein
LTLGVSSPRLYLLSPNTSWHMHIQKKDGLLFHQYASHIEHTQFHLQFPSSYDALNPWYLHPKNLQQLEFCKVLSNKLQRGAKVFCTKIISTQLFIEQPLLIVRRPKLHN